MNGSIDIKQYGLAGLKTLVADWGEPSYRADQLIKWLYGRGVSSYTEMTDLPKALRSRLAAELPFTSPELANRQISRDGSRKYLLRLSDGSCVETVGIPDGTRLTVCFSTQVGCGMGCVFCATGAHGLTRSLNPGEMVDQLLCVSRDFDTRVTNAVAMGEGEPFANYDATLDALRIMNSPDGLGIGARHLTVSTCGLLRQIARFSREPEQFTLAISLHSAVQSTRESLMPALKGQRIDDLRKGLQDYATLSGRRPSLEVTLIAGVNDTPREVDALVRFAQGLLCHVNLISLNSAGSDGGQSDGGRLGGVESGGAKPGGAQSSGDSQSDRVGKSAPFAHSFVAPSSARVAEIARILDAAGIESSIRRSRGADIAAACGQLKS